MAESGVPKPSPEERNRPTKRLHETALKISGRKASVLLLMSDEKIGDIAAMQSMLLFDCRVCGVVAHALHGADELPDCWRCGKHCWQQRP